VNGSLLLASIAYERQVKNVTWLGGPHRASAG